MENASRRLRLSWKSAIEDATTMVIAASAASAAVAPTSASAAGPRTKPMARAKPKTPALTTATACSSAETGVGATIAEGSQACSGMIPDFVPKPSAMRANTATSMPSESPAAAKPPGVNVSVPTWA